MLYRVHIGRGCKVLSKWPRSGQISLYQSTYRVSLYFQGPEFLFWWRIPFLNCKCRICVVKKVCIAFKILLTCQFDFWILWVKWLLFRLCQVWWWSNLSWNPYFLCLRQYHHPIYGNMSTILNTWVRCHPNLVCQKFITDLLFPTWHVLSWALSVLYFVRSLFRRTSKSHFPSCSLIVVTN